MLYPLGILKYHHYPTNDFDQFIKVLDDTIKFVNISNHWRLGQSYVGATWTKEKNIDASDVIKLSNLSDKLEIQIYIRKKIINIREITTEPAASTYEKKHISGCQFITNDYQLVPISENQFNKLPNSFYFEPVMGGSSISST